MSPQAAIALLLLATIVILYISAASWDSGRQQAERAVERGAAIESNELRSVRARRSLDQRILDQRWGAALRTSLDRAGITRPVGDVAAALSVVVLLAGAVAWWALSAAAGVVAGVIVLLAARVQLRRLTRKRRAAFVAQLPQVARLVANGASAGLSLRRTISRSVGEVAEPAQSELRAVAEAMAVGVAMEKALDDLEERMPSRELEVFTRTLVIQVRSGGAVVTALRRMSDTLDRRERLRGELEALFSGVLQTSRLLPIIGIGTVILINGGSRERLGNIFSSPLGLVAVTVAATLTMGGLYYIRRSVDKALS